MTMVAPEQLFVQAVLIVQWVLLARRNNARITKIAQEEGIAPTVEAVLKVLDVLLVGVPIKADVLPVVGVQRVPLAPGLAQVQVVRLNVVRVATTVLPAVALKRIIVQAVADVQTAVRVRVGKLAQMAVVAPIVPTVHSKILVPVQ